MLCIAFILLAGGALKQFPQAAATFDSLFDLVSAQYGGSTLEGTNVELSGTLTSRDGTATPFTLTAQKRTLRFELRKASGTVTTIRQDTRTQVKIGTKTEFPNQIPHSISALNFTPIYALLGFKNDPRYTGSLVVATDGALGLGFTEGTPPGVRPPPFPQPKLKVTFWVSPSYQITSTSYSFDTGPSTLVVYSYSYTSTVSGPFLQPSKVECRLDGRLTSTAEITGTRKDVATTADFFKILELHERQ
jgi:hypothetical protein